MSGLKFLGKRVFVTGMGVISPAGQGQDSLNICFEKNKSRIRALTLFQTTHNEPLPVGEVDLSTSADNIPRTHKLAYLAARQAMTKTIISPDAVVMGVTTGGLHKTEIHLKNREYDPNCFTYHGTGTVAEYIAKKVDCKGPVITISTACSSGAAAIKLGLELLRTGMAKSVLAGGADSLCHLTYYGFNSLQVIDPKASRPLDQNRRGMSVAEGAAILFLEACEIVPDKDAIEILGGGLSCDSYHPATPHPQGNGAFSAMEKALADAGLKPEDIDYINLHGTGTLDNDLAEARAVNRLFKGKVPPVSSVKGMLGHSLAAAGAVESIICSMAVNRGMIPLNTGCETPDPELNLCPVITQTCADIKTVLSNSFGFGGNNACLVLGKPVQDMEQIKQPEKENSGKKAAALTITGYACITGAGNTEETLDKISHNQNCSGVLSVSDISKNLNPKAVRRSKRLPRLALSLAVSAHENSGESENPDSVFLGTGWGSLSETFDFLTKLYESDDQFTSPTDFIGSVHNAPAGQIALHFKAQGPNITTTGGDYSFEQALLAASLLFDNPPDDPIDDLERPLIVMGVDEYHEKLTPAFDRSYIADSIPADGGAAFCLKPLKSGNNSGIKIIPSFFQNAHNNPDIISSMIQNLGGPEEIRNRFGAVMAGIPSAFHNSGKNQLKEFLLLSGFDSCVIDYRKLTGEFASASAVAAAMAANFVENREIPETLCKGQKNILEEKGVLILGFGNFITAVEVS